MNTWSDPDIVMLFVEFIAALCAVAVCGPCLLACARRLIVGDELLRRGGHVIHEAEVTGCDEPNCPYYKKNVRFLLVPAAKRRQYNSPARPYS
ncbi:unnamed protein product [Leptidea sinapis]|uniref:Uncharacterized protein n=1 Tax=Leptidea sinapis TaxID=189913 RepID=A0A5E4Q8G1_9NEOP|nr:unnamed protein product [Leptidea sinapis]